jgi:hypothetical protein
MVVLCLRGEDVSAIRKEPVPERRFERAILQMELSMKEAQDLFKQGAEPARLQAKIEEIGACGDLSLEALRDTGKKPGKLTKQYKRGEVKTRETLRKMESFVAALGFDERPPAEKIKIRLQVVQEEYLLGVMSKN